MLYKLKSTLKWSTLIDVVLAVIVVAQPEDVSLVESEGVLVVAECHFAERNISDPVELQELSPM